MPIVTGTGIDERDSSFFYMFIYHELETQDHISIGRASFSTDFSLIGTISTVGMSQTSSSNEYSFNLNLQDNRTGEIVSEQRYRYTTLNNAELAVLIMLDTIYAQIQTIQLNQPAPQPVQPVQQPYQPVQQPVQPVQQPVQPVQQPAQPVQQPVQPVQQPAQPVQQPVQPVQQPVEQPIQQPVVTDQPLPQPLAPFQPATPEFEGDWREKWTFLGVSGFWAPRFYKGVDQVNLLNFGLGLHAEFRILESVALETGLGLGSDLILDTQDKKYQDFMLEVPLLLKIVIRPADVFLLEPYAGVCFNFPLVAAGVKPTLLSMVMGYQHGVKAGPGAFLFDFRFSMDLGQSGIESRPDLPYQRLSFALGIGYKYGLIPKP